MSETGKTSIVICASVYLTNCIKNQMTVLNIWLQDLGYDKEKLNIAHYNYSESEAFLIPLPELQLKHPYPRKIERPTHIEGMEEHRAKSILTGIFTNEALPPIEVYKRSGTNNYILINGYHRYSVSRFLGFAYIPAVIVKPFVFDEL